MFNLDTPLEEYRISGKTVLVKRDDLISQEDIPGWAGSYILYRYIESLDPKISEIVVTNQTFVNSFENVAVIRIAKKLGFITHMVGHERESFKPYQVAAVKEADRFIKADAVNKSIISSKATRHANLNGLHLVRFSTYKQRKIPMYYEAGEELVERLPDRVGSIVTPIEHNYTLTAMCRRYSNPDIYAIGMESTRMRIRSILHELKFLPENLMVIESRFGTKAIRVRNAEFPMDTHRSVKAWIWLLENIDSLKEPVLFYNSGEYDETCYNNAQDYIR